MYNTTRLEDASGILHYWSGSEAHGRLDLTGRGGAFGGAAVLRGVQAARAGPRHQRALHMCHPHVLQGGGLRLCLQHLPGDHHALDLAILITRYPTRRGGSAETRRL
eukprot:378548-Prorocentrum_minimum.AAC.1